MLVIVLAVLVLLLCGCWNQTEGKKYEELLFGVFITLPYDDGCMR